MIKIIAGFAVLMVMISAGAVYQLKQTTDALDTKKNQISSLILKDQAAIKVLKAEMAYLSRPARLERLSQRFLALGPGQNNQMISSAADITQRGDVMLASFPVDDFRLLLPRQKPKKQPRIIIAKKYIESPQPSPELMPSTDLMQASVSPKKDKDFPVKPKNFYERMIAKLDKP